MTPLPFKMSDVASHDFGTNYIGGWNIYILFFKKERDTKIYGGEKNAKYRAKGWLENKIKMKGRNFTKCYCTSQLFIRFVAAL